MSVVTLPKKSALASAPLPPEIDWDSLVGLRRAFWGSRNDNRDRLGRAVGDIARLSWLGRPVVMVNSPEGVQEVLVRQADAFHKAIRRDSPEMKIVGANTFNAEGKDHREKRKLVAPTLGARRIARFGESMAGLAEAAQRDWSDGEAVPISAAMERLTQNTIAKTVLDYDGFSEDEYGAAQRLLVRYNSEGQRFPSRMPLRWRVPSGRQVQHSAGLLRTLISRQVAARHAGDMTGEDLLTLLMLAEDENGERMSDAQVCNEVLLIILAGTLNVAKSLAWAWYLLIQHPDVYATLQAEVDGVLGGRTPGVDDLPNLPFTLQVFKETMRLKTSSDLMRVAVRDVEIGGFRVPSGTQVWICPYLLHRRPEIYPDPEAFDPARFAPEREKALPRSSYMPFGGGARLCVGNHFALMEGQLILATLAQRVTFTVAPGPRLKPEEIISLRRAGGVRLRVSRRS